MESSFIRSSDPWLFVWIRKWYVGKIDYRIRCRKKFFSHMCVVIYNLTFLF